MLAFLVPILTSEPGDGARCPREEVPTCFRFLSIHLVAQRLFFPSSLSIAPQRREGKRQTFTQLTSPDLLLV